MCVVVCVCAVGQPSASSAMTDDVPDELIDRVLDKQMSREMSRHSNVSCACALRVLGCALRRDVHGVLCCGICSGIVDVR